MKTTFDNYRYLFRSLVVFLVSLMILSACASPTAQPTSASTNTGSGITVVSPTQTPQSTWKTYQDTTYGFQLSYPEQGTLAEGTDGQGTRIDLPFAAGTNLHEKYVQIDVLENTDVCSSPLAQGYEPETLQEEQISVNGIDFHTASGGEGAAGNIYEWTAYTTTRDSTCVSVSFVLHSVNPFNYPTPPPEFDRASETGVFAEIISTFTWTK
jgi:hypothetical protein